MNHVRKIAAAFICVAFIVIGISATRPPEPPKPKNLKILPKNISHEDLEKVMDGFKAALGVRCDFCHAAVKDSSVHRLDFASDEKPEKNIAREMMKMTTKINKKFFSYNKNEQGERADIIECMTCHRGNPHPVEKGK